MPLLLQIVNCAGLVSKWVGDTPKNIDALFQEARATDAVLCFDEAEGLFGTRSSDMGSSTDRYAAMDVGMLSLLFYSCEFACDKRADWSDGGEPWSADARAHQQVYRHICSHEVNA